MYYHDSMVTDLSEYFLKKKYTLLYNIYSQLFSLLLLLPSELNAADLDGANKWILYEDEWGVLAELRRSRNITLDERLSLHKYEYRRLRKQLNNVTTKFNQRGVALLF